MDENVRMGLSAFFFPERITTYKAYAILLSVAHAYFFVWSIELGAGLWHTLGSTTQQNYYARVWHTIDKLGAVIVCSALCNKMARKCICRYQNYQYAELLIQQHERDADYIMETIKYG